MKRFIVLTMSVLILLFGATSVFAGEEEKKRN